jgi:hypothetical protein
MTVDFGWRIERVASCVGDWPSAVGCLSSITRLGQAEADPIVTADHLVRNIFCS